MRPNVPPRVVELLQLIALEQLTTERDVEALRKLKLRGALEARLEVSRIRLAGYKRELGELAPGVQPYTSEEIVALGLTCPKRVVPRPRRKLLAAMYRARQALEG